MRIQDMNTVLEVARQKVMKEYAPDEMDVYMRTLEVAQINERITFRISFMRIWMRSLNHPGESSQGHHYGRRNNACT